MNVTAGVIVITAAGLHGVRLSFKDLQRFKDAPSTIQRLRYEVWAVERALQSLEGIDQQIWDSLGSNVAQQVHDTAESCLETCIWFREKLQRWTRHSTEQELARQDRISITFQQTQIDIVSEKLRDCNLAIISVTGSATLHTSLRNLKLSEERKTEIELTKLVLQRAVIMTGDGFWRLGNMAEGLTKTNGIFTRIDGDTYAELAKKLEDDRKAAEATKTMLMELISNLPATITAVAGAGSQDHSDYNSGFQS